MLQTLDANPGKWDLSGLRVINSSGTVWSHENKQGLLKHAPHITLFDSLGSSEAVGIGGSNSTAGQEAETAKFALGPNTAAFTEDGRRIEPGFRASAASLALSGYMPVGYYKDPEKSAKTFRMFEGRRWSVPGDFRHCRGRRIAHLAWPRLAGDQYRRREGLPGRGRRGAEAAPVGL